MNSTPPIALRALWSSIRFLSLTLIMLAPGASRIKADEPSKTILKIESFDKDPGWEGHNNHIVPAHLPTVTQDFGYSKTNFAGKSAGEMGGQVTRASEPAYCADKIGPKTLDDKLSASGSFALTLIFRSRPTACWGC